MWGLFGWYFARSISNPIRQSTSEMLMLANGDKSFEVSGVGRVDEIGDMASALQTFQENAIKQDEMVQKEQEMVALREERNKRIEELVAQFEADSNQILTGVSAAVSQMNTTSGEMSSVAQNMAVRSNTVAAAAAEEASNRIREVVGLISDIAEQTNLLALNATIKVSTQTGNSSQQILEASEGLARQANDMRKSVEEFIQGIRAA